MLTKRQRDDIVVLYLICRIKKGEVFYIVRFSFRYRLRAFRNNNSLSDRRTANVSKKIEESPYSEETAEIRLKKVIRELRYG